jgi:hypothetical protein
MTHKTTKRLARAVAAAGCVAIIGAATGSVSTVSAADSMSNVQAFANPEKVLGESTLRRTDDGVLATFQSTAFTPGHAVTLWWVVFNQPENCSKPCGEDDIFVGGDPTAGPDAEAIAKADIVAAYAAGTVAGDDGSVTMASRLTAGQPGADVIMGEGALLKDAARAEIHLVARTHGPEIAGQVVEQTTSYGGGCTTLLNPPDQADAEGECVDLQFAVHQP